MIYNYGSINIDNVYRVPHLVKPGETLASSGCQRVLGGKGSNQSLALARAGVEITHLGAIGANDEWIIDYLRESGINTGHLSVLADIPSGHTFIQVDDHAENAIVLYAGANHAIPLQPLMTLFSQADEEDWLLAQNECADVGSIINMALDQNMKIALNPAPMSKEVASLPLDRITLLFVNEGEARALLADIDSPSFEAKKSSAPEQLIERLAHHFPQQEIVLTLGRSGVMYAHGSLRLHKSAFEVDAKDTTGAGDTFVGYFIAARSTGADVPYSLSFASAASALCVQREGASTSIPIRSDVESFLASTNASS